MTPFVYFECQVALLLGLLLEPQLLNFTLNPFLILRCKILFFIGVGQVAVEVIRRGHFYCPTYPWGTTLVIAVSGVHS